MYFCEVLEVLGFELCGWWKWWIVHFPRKNAQFGKFGGFCIFLVFLIKT